MKYTDVMIVFIITAGIVILSGIYLDVEESKALAKEGLQQCMSINNRIIWVKECK